MVSIIRHTKAAWVCGFLLLLSASASAAAVGQLEQLQVPNAPVRPGGETDVPAIVELLEDNTDALIEQLNNNGTADASIAEANEQTHFAGVRSLAVTEVQRFNAYIRGWRYQIAENPMPGQFRYLRFAWKRTEAPGIMLQLHAWPNGWEHRYYAGNLSQHTKSWGSMTRIAEDPPRQWGVVTRDLFTDFGPITITGIGFSALEGEGQAFFDHIYLGRTIEDLDRVTAGLQNVVEPPLEAPWGRVKAPMLSGTAILIAVIGWFLIMRRRRSRRLRLPETQHSGPV